MFLNKIRNLDKVGGHFVKIVFIFDLRGENEFVVNER
ncbi:hypothetical protein EUBDOL_00614 [Amedibacillus dolichus DSM 3991]|uniref:Uncharacterized protein n=1 Tax=Amedibacillus dolichus DSM 3991 TaxID=428127 RepID=A8R9U8_9FIRM|nr:hypothetical protein EUBDOL_00614 [Amedibacillus dolichus DSM 3991]